MRKPAGDHAAYIMCTARLEEEIPQKVPRLWFAEGAEALCSGISAPANIASVVHALDACTVECAVAKAIPFTSGWCLPRVPRQMVPRPC